jgi:glycosyltransferase involved in cell wall biosynthesis
MRVALVYDRINKWGGAERVLLTLHEMFPEAPLYTSVYNPETAKWAKVFPKIYTSFLQSIPFAKNHHEWFPFLMPLAFEQFNLSKYDLVISVTSEFAKNIITKPNTKHICYCLTPTRYLWSGYSEYFKSRYLRFLAKPLVNYLRRVDKIAANRPDEIIAISTEVQSRIKKYYERNSRIIFPPVKISHSHRKNKFPRGFAARNSFLLDARNFLVVSRLVPYKKVDLAVRAFNENGHKLVIVGIGSEEKRLKAMAKENIKFVGQVSEKRLEKYYKNCTALVFPQFEDFGLVAVEALSCGKPVIAYKKGGALDIIKEGKNGVFFEKQNIVSLNRAVERLFTKNFNSDIIVSTSRKFGKERFKREFLKVIKNI